MAAGIEARHSRTCRSLSGGRCNCEPSYRAKIRIGDKRVPYSSRSRAEVEAWLRDARIQKRRGQEVKGKNVATLREVAEEFLSLAQANALGARGGDDFKPATIRSYEAALRLRVYPTLGDEPIAEIRRSDVQELVDSLRAGGLAPATVQAAVTPLKSIFRWAIGRGRLTVNPTTELDLPAVRSRRQWHHSLDESVQLIEAAPEEDRAIWATALYAGLRRGELRALRVADIDLEAGVIRVEHGWDDKEGEQDTKGRNRRKVPISGELARHLRAHLLRTGRRADPRALAFGRTDLLPFDPHRVSDRADAAWKAAGAKRATLHECRHGYASLMIAATAKAGTFNPKALSEWMGHSSIVVTYDKYGDLMPGYESEGVVALDAYLATAAGASA